MAMRVLVADDHPVVRRGVKSLDKRTVGDERHLQFVRSAALASKAALRGAWNKGGSDDLTGKYSLDGNEFDFHGKARMNAKLSHMITGWKSIVLKPVDPFFSKHGAGTEVPVKATGTRSEPHFGLDFRHKD